MKTMTVDEIRVLIAHQSAPCISIYMSTHAGGIHSARKRWDGFLRQARKELAERCNQQQVEALLAPLAKIDEPEFWQDPVDGLALFRSHSATQDWFAHYRLPVHFEDSVVVADAFHTRPLLHFLQSNQRYFLLNLTLGHVSLFQGTAMGLAPVHLPTLPNSFVEVVGAEGHEHMSNVQSTGRRHMSVFHGQGSEDGVHDEERLHFLRTIDKAVRDALRDERVPLVVAAPERLLQQYQRASRYPHMLHDGVHGSFANASLEDLHARAWPLVQQYVTQHEQELLTRWQEMPARDKTSDEVSEIARFAVQGRVSELFVASNAHLPGHMDAATGELELHPAPNGAHREDLLDEIAEAVTLRSGHVYAFDAARMPTKSPVAAILRW